MSEAAAVLTAATATGIVVEYPEWTYGVTHEQKVAPLGSVLLGSCFCDLRVCPRVLLSATGMCRALRIHEVAYSRLLCSVLCG